MRRLLLPGIGVAGALAGVAAAGPVALLPGDVGLAAGAGVLCLVVFLRWPWAVLPVGIIGGTIAAVLLGDGGIQAYVVLHALPLAAGGAALLLRRLAGAAPARPSPPGPVDRRSHLGMSILAVLTVVAAGYGLALGNLPWNVLVATYQIAVIPAYFFLAMHTLDTPGRLRAAAILYLTTAGILTAIELATPGRHGGLLSSLAVPPLMILAGRARGWQRAALVLVVSVFIADVVLASYRGVWLAAGLAVLILLLRGGPVVRRGVAVSMAGAALILVAFSFNDGIRERAAEMTSALERDAGHRMPESAFGWDVFTARPLVGAGLGQSVPQVYVEGFTITDVGPVYHAFYVMILANLGLVGLVAVLWPVLGALRAGLRQRDGSALAFAALTAGFLAAAFFAGPTDGHWELGLLPALTLLAARHRRPHPTARTATATRAPAGTATETTAATRATAETGHRPVAWPEIRPVARAHERAHERPTTGTDVRPVAGAGAPA